MWSQIYLPNAEQLQVEQIEQIAEGVVLHLRLTAPDAACPSCQTRSRHVHSRYMRLIADLPLGTWAVHWCLRIRRFYCINPSCPHCTFAEQVPGIVARFARRTVRLIAQDRELGLALGGEAGKRLTDRLFGPTSPDSLLRVIGNVPEAPRPTPRVLGIDDWALRKGQRYGTILVDHETGHVIDLLPDREPETVVRWLQAHPGIEIVTRDRAHGYADAISQGAPQATQVADRFHLVQNLHEATERLMDRHQTTLRQVRVAVTTPPAESAGSSPTCESAAPTLNNPATEETAPTGKRPERLANYQSVKALQSEGLSLRAIAKRLPINRQTVTRYAKADAFPERAARVNGPDPLQPFIPELLRLAAGGVKTSEALQELRTRNYTGSDIRVYRWARANRLLLADTVPTRPSATDQPPKTRPLSASRAAWLLIKSPDDLRTEEQAALNTMQSLCPPAKLAHELVQDFRTLLRERQAERLAAWLERAVASGLTELRNFATGLKRDLDAVRAALCLPWSNGRTEGHVHRLKLLKRQMYGRASFGLLRKRVLHAA